MPMRQPTPKAELYAWHTAALAHVERYGSMDSFRLGIYSDEPKCGWFQTRLGRKGALVPAAIWMHQVVDQDGELVEPEQLRCEVAGDAMAAEIVWPYLAGRPISEAEYRYQHDLMRWAKAHKPDHPLANPYKPINAADVPLQF